jgi:hypothetical protein
MYRYHEGGCKKAEKGAAINYILIDKATVYVYGSTSTTRRS